MSAALPIVMVVLLVAIVGVLLFGVVTMARDGDSVEKHRRSNKLMQLRVLLQFAAVGVILLFLFVL
ncbi:MAG: twin transmembrane helix small protein [Alphaproteobacteria bacterium]